MHAIYAIYAIYAPNIPEQHTHTHTHTLTIILRIPRLMQQPHTEPKPLGQDWIESTCAYFSSFNSFIDNTVNTQQIQSKRYFEYTTNASHVLLSIVSIGRGQRPSPPSLREDAKSSLGLDGGPLRHAQSAFCYLLPSVTLGHLTS